MSEENAHEQMYLVINQDIVRRLGVAADALRQIADNPSNPNNFAGCEVAIIQVRKVCESILLASTTCHFLDQRIEISDKKWRPKDAFFELDQVNEHPLPVPVQVNLNHNGEGHHHVVPISKPLPFPLLSKIYGICGDLLHVPTLRQVKKGTLPQYDLVQLGGWISGLSQLMAGHALMLPKREIVMLCLWNGDYEKGPEILRLEAQGESTLDLAKLKEFELFS